MISIVDVSEERNLLAGERIDDIGFGGLKLIQKPEEFCYGIDAVMLADFAAQRHKGPTDVVVDLGTGTGIIPLIISHKLICDKIYGVEIQQDSYGRACRNAKLNSLENIISFINDDISNVGKTWGHDLKGKADIVVTNPPYFENRGGLKNNNAPKTIARHETTAGLMDFLTCAAYLLKPKGELFMIHRPFRLADICCFGRECKLEPKELQFISPKRDSAANLILVHMVKDGGRELRLLNPLWVYDERGQYTREVLSAYERK